MQNEVLGISIGLAIKGIGEISKINSSFVNLKGRIKQSEGSLKGFSRELAKIKKFENIKLKLKANAEELKADFTSATSLIARSAAIALPVKTAIDFEESMADVRKVVDFETKDELKKFGGEILALTREIPLSASELATITASGGQLGIAKENLLEFTTIAAKMGVAFDMGASEAGDSMGKMMNIFGMDIKAVSSLGDAINHLSDNSASRAKEIVEVLKRIGGTAKTIGMTATQASSLASAFISLGKTPELAATSADTLMKKLGNIKEDKNMQETLAKIGMDPQYVAANMAKAPEQMIMMFLESVKKLKGAEQLKLLTDIFGDGFAGDIALLVNGLDTYKKAIKDVANSEAYAGSMDKEFKNKSDTTANALQILKNAVNEIAINFGSVFLPAIANGSKAIAGLISSVANFTGQIPGLNTVLGFSIAGFLILKPAIASVRLASNYLMTSWISLRQIIAVLNIKKGLMIARLTSLSLWHKINAVSSNIHSLAITKLGASMSFLKKALIGAGMGARILKLALISTGIGALVVIAGEIIANWDKVKEWFFKFGAWMKGIFQPVIDWFGENFGGMFDWIGKKISWIVDSFKSVGKFLGFGGDTSPNGAMTPQNTSSSWYNRFSDDEPTTSPSSHAPIGVASLSTGGTININLNGGFNIATSNGKFDLAEFEAALIDSVKRALARDERNRQNRMVAG
ncbi:TP901 family tail tape measure protein [Campylobacter hyointestinalis subsp. hyointestinalis]|uniref:phage tail tape measure protein n=1 Tax=Campylobacter hyointestinalis TaxID=198 RepID=UPI00072BF3D5|nr:phage tail tape measure protein [Campylobacter hyointestinalis]CUU87897.1 TP901 family tail tape measure protein [Campylobacter hyointestinalis subsp. hyointestinalis]